MQAATFAGPEVGWFALSPILVLVGTALVLLVVGALTPRWPRGSYAFVTAAAAGAAAVLAMVLWGDITDDGPSTLVGGALAFDAFAMFVTITICAGLLLVVAGRRRLPPARGLRWAGGVRADARRRHRRRS